MDLHGQATATKHCLALLEADSGYGQVSLATNTRSSSTSSRTIVSSVLLLNVHNSQLALNTGRKMRFSAVLCVLPAGFVHSVTAAAEDYEFNFDDTPGGGPSDVLRSCARSPFWNWSSTGVFSLGCKTIAVSFLCCQY